MWKQIRVRVSLGLVLGFVLSVSAQVPSSLNVTIEQEGDLEAIAVQADGRILIGGQFSLVNGQPRQNLARLNADGSLDDSWNPPVGGHVYAIAVTGTNIYIGGSFTNVGALTRNRIAKLDYYTGAVLSNVWSQGVDATVYALATSANDIYVGGAFTQVGPGTHRYITKLDRAGIRDIAFTNEANGIVRALYVDGTDIYAGGDFTSIGGATRHYLAQLHYFNGMALAWDPSPNGEVYSLAADSGNIYAAGLFTSIGGQSRNAVAKINISTGNADAVWDVGIQGFSWGWAVDNDLFNVYIGGAFTNVAGQAADGFVKVDLTTGVADPLWTNQPNTAVQAIDVVNTNIYVGGDFTAVGADWAHGFTRLEPTNGAKVADFNTTVSSLAWVKDIVETADGRILIGGSITAVNGKEAHGAVALLPSHEVDPNWNPRLDGTVECLKPYGSSVYVCGSFLMPGASGSRHLTRLDLEGGAVMPGWTNQVGWEVKGLALDDTYLYAGGYFTNFNGRAVRYLARIRHSDNQLDVSWLPQINDTVFSLAADSTHLYVGGAFTIVDGHSFSNLVRYSIASGLLDTLWTPQPNDWVTVLNAETNLLYASGYFSEIGGGSLWNVARLSKSGAGAVDLAWNVDWGGGVVYDIQHDGEFVYLGGTFITIGGGEKIPYLARVAVTDAVTDTAWVPAPDQQIRAISVSGDSVWCGGHFQNIWNMSRVGLAELLPFGLEDIERMDQTPVLTWRSGSNMTYTVEFTSNADGTYSSITNGLAATSEINAFVDAGRSNAPRGFYLIKRE